MKTELEKCLAGELFNGGDKVLADMTLNAKRLLKQLNETDYADTEQRKRIFHDLFGKMGNMSILILISIVNTGSIFSSVIRLSSI